MDTKEAIEFFKTVIDCIKKGNFIYIRRLDDKRFNEVITLLEQGEVNKKYKAMWEEAISYFNSIDDDFINRLKQKYFPKESDLEYNGEEK